MKTIGRNDPCHCGSGKKYKKCCQLADQSRDFSYRRHRNLEVEMINRVRDHAFQLHDFHTFEEAWHEFNDDNEIEIIPPDSPMLMIFMPWFLFHWRFMNSQGELSTNAVSFIESPKEEITEDELRFLVSAGTSQYSLFEVVHTNPGFGLRLRDLFTNEEIEIAEHAASQALQAGQIIYSALMNREGVYSNLGTAPFVLRPTSKREILELRKQILRRERKKKFSRALLMFAESDIRNFYLDKVDEMLLPPRMTNTDGDEMVFHKIYYQLASPVEAFERLKDLAADDYFGRELNLETKFKGQKLIEAEIPWYGGTQRARKQHSGPILLGSIKISEHQLVAEVNSRERAAKIQEIISERLVGITEYKRTLIEPLQKTIDEMWESALTSGEAGTLKPGSSRHALDPDDSEVRKILEKVAREHWSSWYDIPVPALNDMTPREAARDKEGRVLLESLLLEYAINNERADEFNRADIPAIRKKLGMD